jgi:gluconate 2-dehydrogenase gamma chain
MDRRLFLVSSGLTLSAALLGRLEAFAAAVPVPTPLLGAGIEPAGWRILGLVHEHLFPSEPQAPGAREVNALSYLHFVMTWKGTDPVETEILRSGLEKLREIVAQPDGGTFEALDAQGREQALRTLEASEGGTQWITLVLDYIFEALLADPVYGGNPDGIGWRWLQFQPGRRRPGPDQRYFAL